MGRLWGRVAATAAALILACISARAGDGGPNNPAFLLFAGTDLWRDGAFLNGGMLWSPGGLAREGFTFKVLLNGGLYDYPSGGPSSQIDGTLVSASAMPGWRIENDGVTLSMYVGPIVEDFRLTPFDPGSLLHGLYTGAQLSTDIWYQPSPTSMVAFDGAVASIALIGSARAAFGWRFSTPFFVGPEVQALWCLDYQQWRVGAHVTGFRIDGLEWSAAAGLAAESDGRVGPYLRLGAFMKY